MKNAVMIFLVIMFSFVLVSCTKGEHTPIDYGDIPFSEIRQNFQTNIVHIKKDETPLYIPQNSNFEIVSYPSLVGELSAYITIAPEDGGRHPAILWVRGGYDNTISLNMLSDETLNEYLDAGIIVMYPGLRGGNQNPGSYESCYGEVDDIISALEYLLSLDYVDPDRIYLGGHSNGGTLALLATAITDRFRASFVMGAMDRYQNYNLIPKPIVFDVDDQREYDLRSPILWLDDIKTPTFVFAGTKDGNYRNFRTLDSYSQNSSISFFTAGRANHQSVLDPIATLIAQKIKDDDGTTINILFNEQEVNIR